MTEGVSLHGSTLAWDMVTVWSYMQNVDIHIQNSQLVAELFLFFKIHDWIILLFWNYNMSIFRPNE